MIRFRERLWDTVAAASGVLVTLAALLAIYNAWLYLPRLDGWLFPVIRFGEVTDIERDPEGPDYPTGRACFSLHPTKLANAVPITYRFRVSTWLSPEINTSAHLVNAAGARIAQKWKPHPAGEQWTTRYCFDMPGTISDEDAMTVTGTAFHRRHPFWLTETPTPTFTIGAISKP